MGDRQWAKFKTAFAEAFAPEFRNAVYGRGVDMDRAWDEFEYQLMARNVFEN